VPSTSKISARNLGTNAPYRLGFPTIKPDNIGVLQSVFIASLCACPTPGQRLPKPYANRAEEAQGIKVFLLLFSKEEDSAFSEEKPAKRLFFPRACPGVPGSKGQGGGLHH
jgi:hypothetical protein